MESTQQTNEQTLDESELWFHNLDENQRKALVALKTLAEATPQRAVTVATYTDLIEKAVLDNNNPNDVSMQKGRNEKVV